MPTNATFRRRSMIVTVAALLVAGTAALAWPRSSAPTEPSAASTVPPSASTGAPSASQTEQPQPDQLARQVCRSVPREILVRTANGAHPTRSGDVQMITPQPDYVDGGLTHATPFDPTQRVPLFVYAPGRVKPGVYDEPAHLTDVSATAASLLEFDGFTAPDGRPLDEALRPPEERDPPKLVITLVWDSAGVDLLDRWPSSWPYLRDLSKRGAWFTNASLNSAPANTPPSHATIGTGAYPRHHGMADEYIRIKGELMKPNSEGPTMMLQPTLGDLYDLAMNNEPVVGAAGSLSAHIMMMSHGLGWTGGDDDIAIAREVQFSETGGDDTAREWGLTTGMRPYYRFPDWANDDSIEAALAEAKTSLDQRDGSLDGLWRGFSIEGMEGGFNTPARSPYQTALFEQMIERERFGADKVPDLLYLNYKIIDTLGHQFSADGEEMTDALEVQDEELRRFVAFLNQEVGRGDWAMILTADHGMQRDPAVTGAYLADIDSLVAAVEAEFGGTAQRPVIQKARPTQLWLDVPLLRRYDHSVEQVADFIAGLTQAELISGASAAPATARPAFQAVFPTSTIERMPCLPASVRAR
jgi:hypothetical protein